MHKIYGLPTTGGATFYTLGAATQGLTPFKTKFSWLNPLYQKTLKGGVIGATSIRAAEITELAYESFMSEKDFASEFNDLYPEGDCAGCYSVFDRKLLVDMLVFKITGFSHVKKTDFMTTGAKERMMDRLVKENDAMIYDAAPTIENKKVGLEDVFVNPERHLTEKQLKK